MNDNLMICRLGLHEWYFDIIIYYGFAYTKSEHRILTTHWVTKCLHCNKIQSPNHLRTPMRTIIAPIVELKKLDKFFNYKKEWKSQTFRNSKKSNRIQSIR